MGRDLITERDSVIRSTGSHSPRCGKSLISPLGVLLKSCLRTVHCRALGFSSSSVQYCDNNMGGWFCYYNFDPNVANSNDYKRLFSKCFKSGIVNRCLQKIDFSITTLKTVGVSGHILRKSSWIKMEFMMQVTNGNCQMPHPRLTKSRTLKAIHLPDQKVLLKGLLNGLPINLSAIAGDLISRSRYLLALQLNIRRDNSGTVDCRCTQMS